MGRGYYIKRIREELGTLEEDVSQRRLRNSTIKLDELIKLCDEEGIDYPEQHTKDDVRTIIRGYIGKDTSRNCKFVESELHKILHLAKSLKYLDAENVDESFFEEVERGTTLQIDDESYTVNSKVTGSVDEAPHSRFIYYLLDNNEKRLMFLFDLDKSACMCNSSVILEKGVDYAPYKHWRKVRYVEDIKH